MGQRIEVKPKPKPSGIPSLGGTALYLLDRALMIVAVAVGFSVVYLLQAVISGAAGAFPNAPSGTPLSPAEQERLLHGLRLAAAVFMGGMWTITIVSIFRFRENDVAGYVGGLGGLLCYFALPWLVRSALMNRNQNPSAASDLMLASFGATGKVLLLTTIVYFAGKMVLRLATHIGKPGARPAPVILDSDAGEHKPVMPTEKTAPRRSLLRQCWELSMCRDSLRENCPSYKLGVTCWKRGTGCQCDPALAQRLIEELEFKLRGDLSEKERTARERMKEQLAYRIAEHQGSSYCHQCAVYNEHQFYKYKSFFWLAYPITAALVFLLLPFIHKAYRWIDTTLSGLLASLQMLPTSDEALRPFVHTVYNFNAEIIFIISTALIIAAYLLDLMDYAVFKAKI
jgi:hypothetical protein